jgi:hypothetical protein
LNESITIIEPSDLQSEKNTLFDLNELVEENCEYDLVKLLTEKSSCELSSTNLSNEIIHSMSLPNLNVKKRKSSMSESTQGNLTGTKRLKASYSPPMLSFAQPQMSPPLCVVSPTKNLSFESLNSLDNAFDRNETSPSNESYCSLSPSLNAFSPTLLLSPPSR